MPLIQNSIGRDAAVKLYNSQWWKGKSNREIVEFQLFTSELSVPFKVFHKAIEAELKRPVYTHEFGLDAEGLQQEFLGNRPAPTFEDIINLIPEDKRLVVVRQ